MELFKKKPLSLHLFFMILVLKYRINFLKQECIQVGCVPPALYHMAGASLTETLLDRDPPRQRPPWTENPPGQRSPGHSPPGQRPP